MAFVAPLIVGAIGLTGTAALIGTAVIDAGLAIGAAYLARRLQPKPSTSAATAVQSTSLSLRAVSNESREIALGRCASAGSLKFWNTYGPNGADYLQLVIVLADHECDDDGLEKLYVDGVEKTLGPRIANGSVSGCPVSGFESNMWVEFHNGAWDQDADGDLVAHASGWTSDDRGRGVCYARVTMLYDASVFANGIPEFLFVFRGAKLYDWRADSSSGGSGAQRWGQPDTYAWTANPTVCLYNFHRGIFVGGSRLAGMGTPALALPLGSWTAAANACDEDVDLKAGGTEPRYRMGGLLQVTDRDNASIVKEILGTMAAELIDSGGVFRPLVGVAQATVLDLTDEDLVTDDSVEIVPKLSRAQLINSVYGSFTDPAQMFSSQPLPPRISPDDQETDGGYTLDTSYALDFVQSGTQGQRVLEILRRKGRLQLRLTGKFRSRLAVLEAGDWVSWTSSRYGWTGAVFEVLTSSLNRDLTTPVELREIATSAFAWSEAEDELDPADPAPVDAGGSSFSTVLGVSLTTVLFETDGGAQRPGLRITWTPVTDQTVTQLRLQYRKAGETEVLEKVILDPSTGQYSWAEGIQGETIYEARLEPVTVPARTVAWSGWAASGSTVTQIVEVAQLASAVPPGTITPEMLDEQTRFELALVTAADDVLGSVAQVEAEAREHRERTAESAINAVLQGMTNRALWHEEQVFRIAADRTLGRSVDAIFDDASDLIESARDAAQLSAQEAIRGLLQNHTNQAAIRVEQLTRQNAIESIAAQIEVIVAGYQAGDATTLAAITTEQIARADADGALAVQVNSVEAALADETTARSAAITAEAIARADADGTLAASIATVSTTVDGHTSSISTISSSVDGIRAQWAVVIDIDGNIVGSVKLDGSDDNSEFSVTADTFKVAFPGDPDGAAVPVFAIANVGGTPKVALRADMIVDGAITAQKLNVASLDTIAADVGEITAGVLRSSDSKFVIDLDAGTLVITT